MKNILLKLQVYKELYSRITSLNGMIYFLYGLDCPERNRKVSGDLKGKHIVVLLKNEEYDIIQEILNLCIIKNL
ncbi:hypothetical protein CN618_10070 [Bacillus wiedmannii]|nr:hypothetical protein CN618_10070 [Bacillus wiedmannii]SEJ69601.1 hypothetical protein SAMN04487780_11319 [Bacillus thuringiensis]